MKQIQNFLSSISVISTLSIAMFTSHAQAFETAAQYAIIQDFATKQLLYEKNAHERLTPSSMTKIMTLYLLFNYLEKGSIKLNDSFHISEKAWSTGGSKMFLGINSDVKIEDLIKGIAVQSGNDACVAVAEGLSGTEELFVDEMNDMAKKLGMNNTHFTNASGLPDPEHYSTAYDISLISLRLIKDFPQYYHYLSQREYTYQDITQQNRNRLLNIMGVDGVKTGHTEEGGYGIAISAKQHDRRIIAVINGLKGDNERKKEGESIVRFAFGNFVWKTLYDAQSKVIELPVVHGNIKTVAAIPGQELTLILEKRLANSDSLKKAKVVYKYPLIAPIKKGDHIADLVVEINGGRRVFKLFAADNVEKRWRVSYLFDNIKHIK